MARLTRICLPGLPLHIIQRGNNRQRCFASEADYAAYAHWLEEYSRKCVVAIHAWVFMTNHVHLLVTPGTEHGVSDLMQMLGRRYVRYFNHVNLRTGTLWEGRFKSCVVDADEYLLICQRYIESNPVRAGMVSAPEDYAWSSYRAHGFGCPTRLWSPHQLYQDLGKTPRERMAAYRAMFAGHLGDDRLHDIRQATNQGMVLGTNRFKKTVEDLAGRRVSLLKRGPRRRDSERSFYSDPNLSSASQRS
ncbi:MAG: transposase [Gammaproteobacteria bacterium]|nr:transposase [Gammaproteobacteria bacterium]